MAREWYYTRDGKRYGPVPSSTLKQLAEAGSLRPTDLVWKEGLAGWVHATSLKGLFSETAPAPSSYAHYPDEDTAFPRTGSPVAGLAWHLSRALAWDLQAVAVSAAERQQLVARGVEDETAQRYLAWRRSVLLAIVLPNLLGAVFHTIDIAKWESANLTPFGSAALGLVILSFYCLPLASLTAALSWVSPRTSRAYVVLGWVSGFLVPCLVALCPLKWMVSFSLRNPTSFGEAFFAMGLMAFLVYYVALMSSVLTLVPGLLRACLRVKSLLPESVLPGWFLVGAAPMYVLLFLGAFIVVNQATGNILPLMGMALWLLAPMLFVARAGLFVRPVTSLEQKRAITGVQWVFTGAVGLAVVFVSIYLNTEKAFDRRLFGLDEKTAWVSAWRALEVCAGYVGRTFYITVLAADLVLRANVSAWRSLSHFGKTAEAADFDKRMIEIENITG